MTSLKRFLAIAVIGALAATGLLVAPSVAAGSAAAGTTLDYTVRVNHKVTVTLVTKSDGGYGWAVTQGRDATRFKILSKKVIPAKNAPGVVGGDSKTVFVLKMLKTGNATFKAVERRAFDKQDVIDRFTLHLHIKR